MFDGDHLSGPVPSLFSEKVDSSEEGLNSDPIKTHSDIARIHKAFFMPETLSILEASTLFKKPRYN